VILALVLVGSPLLGGLIVWLVAQSRADARGLDQWLSGDAESPTSQGVRRAASA
jgi:hypothetical protein